MGTKVAFPGRSLWRRLGRCLSRFIGAEVGSVAIIGAVMMPVIVLAAGLWVETGYWYSQQRKVQSAADVAAFAAGVRIRAGDGATAYRTAARFAAAQSGVDLTTVAEPVSVTFPYNGDTNLVEVRVTERHPRYLTAIIPDALKSSDDILVRGRAVVRLVGREATSGCVLALSRTMEGALSVSGATTVALKGCDLASNSAHTAGSFTASGSGSLTANCIRTVGGTNITSRVTLSAGCPVRFAPPSRDPYASLPMPSLAGIDCTNMPNLKPNELNVLSGTANAGLGAPVRCYEAPGGANSFLDIKGRVELGPGLHIFRSNLRFTAGGGGEPAELTGSGATLYFADGFSMTLNGQAKLTLTPPTPTTTGIGAGYPYMGISVLGDRSTTTIETFQINGPANLISIQGAIYAPSAKVDYTGNATMTTTWGDGNTTNDGCLQIIAQSVSFTGSSYLASDCQGTGTKPLYSYETVELFE